MHTRSGEDYLLGLKLVPEFSRWISKVLKVFGSAERAWHATNSELVECLGITAEKARSIADARSRIDLAAESRKMDRLGVEMLIVNDPDYPATLRETDGPAIFFQGDLVRRYECAVAMVGSRKASLYGREFAFELAGKLSELGITIVSGLARGIDSAAHRGAVSAKGGTIAVLGCGLDVIYPPENKGLYKEISEKGSVISEYPLGTLPFSYNFPARNRIISGLSDGVIIVEASERSGAIITADFALDQGREVMVVPGSVKSSVSKGCHKLIKQGACLVDSIDDVLQILGLDLRTEAKEAQAKHLSEVEITWEEQAVLDYLEWDPKRIDQIVQAVSFDASQVACLLTILELKGLIKQDMGGNYLRIV